MWTDMRGLNAPAVIRPIQTMQQKWLRLEEAWMKCSANHGCQSQQLQNPLSFNELRSCKHSAQYFPMILKCLKTAVRCWLGSKPLLWSESGYHRHCLKFLVFKFEAMFFGKSPSSTNLMEVNRNPTAQTSWLMRWWLVASEAQLLLTAQLNDFTDFIYLESHSEAIPLCVGSFWASLIKDSWSCTWVLLFCAALYLWISEGAKLHFSDTFSWKLLCSHSIWQLDETQSNPLV